MLGQDITAGLLQQPALFVGQDVGGVAGLDLEPQQAPSLMVVGDGQVLLGTANPGAVVRLYDRYAESGTLTSAPLDAEQVSLWGKFQVMASMPAKTAIQLQTRSGNVADPEAGSWSDWSAPHTLELDAGASAYLDIASPTARYLQYRFTLKSDDGAQTPKLVRIALPGLGNLWMALLKDTALVSVVGLTDILRQTGVAARVTKQAFEFYGVACVLFLILAMISSIVFANLERWTKRAEMGR